MGDVRKRPTRLHRSRDKLEEGSIIKDILTLVLKILVIVGAFIIVFTFIYGLHQVVDQSMRPAFQDGDIIVYYRLNKDLSAQDVVLLNYQGQQQVRRVVAVSGDTVDITTDGLVINGALQQEQDIGQKTQRYEQGVTFPLTVGNGEVFVLADVRDNATDSRIYGCVKETDCLGSVFTLLRRRSF